MTPAAARRARLAAIATTPTRHLHTVLAWANARRAASGDEHGHERALIAVIYAEMDARKEQRDDA